MAIANLCMRSAVRSRTMAGMTGLLLASIIILPLSVHGDGTAQGETTVILTYTLGASAIIQAIGTLWASCAGIPIEISEGQMQLMLTKPLSGLEMWLGKWIGVVVLNCILLTIVFSVVTGLLHFKLARMELSPEEREEIRATVLNCRQRNDPSVPPVRDKARAYYEKMFKPGSIPTDLTSEILADALTPQAQRQYEHMVIQGKIPPNAKAGDLIAAFTRKAAENHVSIQPGGSYVWDFKLPAKSKDEGFWVNFHYSAAGGAVTPVDLVCDIIEEGTITARKEVQRKSGMEATLYFEPGSISTSSPSVRIAHIGGNDSGGVLISERNGVSILTPSGSFPGNLLRALLITLAAMMALSAFGLTAGAMFSLPVAVLSATTILLVALSGNYYSSNPADYSLSEEAGTTPSVIQTISVKMLSTAGTVTSPVLNSAPYSSLAQGIRIPFIATLKALLLLGLGAPLILAPFSAFILRLRELARGAQG